MGTKRLALAAALAVLVAAAGVLLLRAPTPPVEPPVAPPDRVLGAVPAPVDDPLVRLAVTGDTGTGDGAEAATVDEMVEQDRQGPPYDALVLLGDLVYEEGDAELVDSRVVAPFAPLTAHGTELVPVLGNHDYESGEQDRILARLGRDRSWYVVRVGPVRIVALDSERVDDERQQRWLERVLTRPQRPGTWTIAAMHHPAYSAGEHGSTASVQERWAPLFAAHGVDLVLAGHDHDYQRSKPLDGVTYVVSGAGAKLRPTGRADFTAVSASVLHFVDVLVYEDHLEARAVDQSGRLVDSFRLTHP